MMWNEPWIDTRLSKKEMDFLHKTISEENKENLSKTLAGNIFKSELIKDKNNWFYETALKELCERMFYRNYNNYYEDYIEKEEPPTNPEFELEKLWVNYQRQYEFNPMHTHFGLYSFVVFMKIPTHWKEQHALPMCANSNIPSASNFAFVWTEKDNEICESTNFLLSSEDEGRILFFPASLKHMVYPFYECKEERITISGNIVPKGQNIPKELKIFVDGYEEKEYALKIMENNVKEMKKELKWMKKADENVE